MNRPLRFAAGCLLLLSAAASASPADAARVEKNYQLALEQWSLAVRTAATNEARAKAWAARPDPAVFAKEMWTVISPALREQWTLEPAAWFLSITPGLRTPKPNGSSSLTFGEEITALQAAIETHHLKSAKLSPVCLALASSEDPRSLALLEKIQTAHADVTVQGVAALAIAMRLKALGDDPGLMKKRLTLLRKAIIDSADVEINGVTVAKLAEDELYIIRFLTKGRIAPELLGADSGGRPLKLADYRGKVVVLLFWNSGMPEAGRVLEMVTAMEKKFAGKPFAVIGVNNDTTANLREMQKQAELVTFPNFSDPQNRLAHEYRVGSWPLAYVLDGTRKIHYAGQPGSFVEFTATALLEAPKPAGNN
ncbi:MAG: TlpA disulfide reductase family protein [Verrucomicrobia bacterium]|nr:TlpA disulfide reductase family protein [Verrucomicrobiota bacterium]